MTKKISKSNAEWETIEQRLAEVRLSRFERVKAEAQLARAEAVADALAALSASVKRALKHLFERPYHHPNASIR
ncbi:MAG TPA: hypothetical protein VMT02_06900 [Burkholderiales bacterium]|jgi:hypothetical protein|nr:hypothetical protein [Burkholderiales bacterium]